MSVPHFTAGSCRSRLIASWVVLLFVGGTAFGEEMLSDDPLPGPVRDHQIALLGRLELANDPSLSGLGLNLGVTVRGGVAIVWGTVPSAAVGRQTEAVLRRIPGVLGVRAEYRILAPDDPVAEFLRRPPASSGGLPPPELARGRPAGALTTRSGEWAAGASPLLKPPDLSVPGAVDLQAPVPVTLGLPIGLPDSDPRPAPSADVADAVNRLVHANMRYQGVQPVVEGGLVRLRGFVSRPEDMFALAQEVARLPGVERVVVDKVNTPPARR